MRTPRASARQPACKRGKLAQKILKTSCESGPCYGQHRRGTPCWRLSLIQQARDPGQAVQWHELTIAVEIARYTATDAYVGRHGPPAPPDGRGGRPGHSFKWQGYWEHLCAYWSSAATASADGPPRCTYRIAVTTSRSWTT